MVRSGIKRYEALKRNSDCMSIEVIPNLKPCEAGKNPLT
jgi:hypothetical protein